MKFILSMIMCTSVYNMCLDPIPLPKKYNSHYESIPNQISFLSYDLVGLIYYLIYKNEFKISDDIFYKKNRFKGKIGIFEINKNVITHQLNFYSVEDNQFKKIF